jgi:TorA maturation chaperone TorD
MDAAPMPVALATRVEAEVLARLWSRPTPAELRRCRDLARQHPDAIDELLGVKAGIWLDDANTVALCAEYDRRIGGPHAWPASPYESMWRDDVPPTQRHGKWPPAMASLRWIYDQLPLARPPDAVIDELTVELDALAIALAEDSTRWLAAILVEEHLARWLPGFLQAVAQTSGEPFYRRLADATSMWLTVVESEISGSRLNRLD